MTKKEAAKLAAQLGIEGNFIKWLDTTGKKQGYQIAVEHATGDWVVLDKTNKVVARCS